MPLQINCKDNSLGMCNYSTLEAISNSQAAITSILLYSSSLFFGNGTDGGRGTDFVSFCGGGDTGALLSSLV